MKRLALIPLLATAAIAAHAQTYVDNARVSNVEPQYESVLAPRQECSNQWVSEPRRDGGRDGGRNAGGAVLGGIVGGLIGNQIGSGHSRGAATAVGAVLGALTGNKLANRDRWQQPESREVTTCRDVEDVQSHLIGYQVTYDYHGQQYTTLMQQDPGRFVPVRVSVDLVGR